MNTHLTSFKHKRMTASYDTNNKMKNLVTSAQFWSKCSDRQLKHNQKFPIHEGRALNESDTGLFLLTANNYWEWYLLDFIPHWMTVYSFL